MNPLTTTSLSSNVSAAQPLGASAICRVALSDGASSSWTLLGPPSDNGSSSGSIATMALSGYELGGGHGSSGSGSLGGRPSGHTSALDWCCCLAGLRRPANRCRHLADAPLAAHSRSSALGGLQRRTRLCKCAHQAKKRFHANMPTIFCMAFPICKISAKNALLPEHSKTSTHQMALPAVSHL